MFNDILRSYARMTLRLVLIGIIVKRALINAIKCIALYTFTHWHTRLEARSSLGVCLGLAYVFVIAVARSVNCDPSRLLPTWFPFHPSRMWCHTRSVYLPMSYLYAEKVKSPVNPLISELRKVTRSRVTRYLVR